MVYDLKLQISLTGHRAERGALRLRRSLRSRFRSGRESSKVEGTSEVKREKAPFSAFRPRLLRNLRSTRRFLPYPKLRFYEVFASLPSPPS